MDRGDGTPGRVFRAPVCHIASPPIWSEGNRVRPDLGHRDSLPQSSGDHVYRGHRFPSVVRNPGPPLVRMRNKGNGDGLGARRYRFSQFSGCQGYGHDSVGALIRHISGLAVRGDYQVIGPRPPADLDGRLGLVVPKVDREDRAHARRLAIILRVRHIGGKAPLARNAGLTARRSCKDRQAEQSTRHESEASDSGPTTATGFRSHDPEDIRQSIRWALVDCWLSSRRADGGDDLRLRPRLGAEPRQDQGGDRVDAPTRQPPRNSAGVKTGILSARSSRCSSPAAPPATSSSSTAIPTAPARRRRSRGSQKIYPNWWGRVALVKRAPA